MMIEDRRGGTDRRPSEFLERLSLILIHGALIGGFIVLFDIKVTLTIYDQVINVGSGFAPETKGMVLQSMLISGFAAVVAFWYGATKAGVEQARSQSRIAEAVPLTTAAAVAASVGTEERRVAEAGTAGKPIVAEDVNVEAKGDVTIERKPKGE